jgi:hypothetical protein
MKRESDGEAFPRSDRFPVQDLADIPPWEWPRDTPKRLLDVLNDRSASEPDRLIAARCAGDMVVVNDALVKALLRVVGAADESDEIRAAAAISLGPVLEHTDTFEFDDPEDTYISEDTFDLIQLAFEKLFVDESVPVLVRRRILEASVRAPEDWHRVAIELAYLSRERDWMLTAVFAMRHIRGFDRQILEALKSPDAEIHREAVWAAGNWGIDAAWDHGLALVENPSTAKSMRLSAIEALGSIRPAEARPVLIELQESDDEDIADAAEEALATMMPEDFDLDEESELF